MVETEQKTVRKGFAYGWGLQVQVGLMFFFFAFLTCDLQNVIVPFLVHTYGWDYGPTLSVATYAGWAGVVGTIVIAQILSRRGNRFSIVLSLIASGIFAIIMGQSKSYMMYLVFSCVMFFFAFSYGAVLTGSLTASWFPRRRGYALGWSSIGMPLSTCISLPIFTLLAHRIGIPSSIMIFGIAVIVLGIVSIFWVKNTPEEVGLFPDGDDSNLEELEATRKAFKEYKSPWTIGKLLKTPVVWIQSFCYGLLFLVVIGVIGQWIPRMTQEMGYDVKYATMMLSIIAATGIVGSIVWGWIDLKIGTKKATIAYAVWTIVAVVILLFSKTSTVLTWIGLFMIGSSIGGIGNLSPSMLVQTFGRWDFAAASRVVNTITNLIRASAFAIIGLGVHWVGSITGSYYILLGCAIAALILSLVMNDKLIGKEG